MPFKRSEAPACVEVIRCRNGFFVRPSQSYGRGADGYSLTDLYVFNTLAEVTDFLVCHDFEITEE